MNSMIVAEHNPHAKSESPARLGLDNPLTAVFFNRPAHVAFLAMSDDTAFDSQPSGTSELAAWAQRASMANGFGDVGLCREPHLPPARGDRSASLREILSAIVDALRNLTRGWIAQLKQDQLQTATYRALGELDARTLHDIGLERSELRSIAAELTGEAEPSRVHSLARLRSHSI
jgi:uncharacterized protein YjiS (DUF1127 family)